MFGFAYDIILVLFSVAFGMYCLHYSSPEKKKNLRRWGITSLVLGILFAIISLIRNFEPSSPPPQQTSASRNSMLPGRRFSQARDTIIFNLGNNNSVWLADTLRRKAIRPFVFDKYAPFTVYIENDSLYCDVRMYHGLSIVHNELHSLPLGWDWNSNSSAIEIVDNNLLPMYQLIYKNPSTVAFYGVFQIPSGFVMVGENGQVRINPQLSADYSLSRIFKYPSWKYPSQIDETGSARTKTTNLTDRSSPKTRLYSLGDISASSSGRFIPEEVAIRVIAYLKKFPNKRVEIFCAISNDAEPLEFSNKLGALFALADWHTPTVIDQHNVMIPPPRGIVLSANNSTSLRIAKFLQEEFSNLGYLATYTSYESQIDLTIQVKAK